MAISDEVLLTLQALVHSAGQRAPWIEPNPDTRTTAPTPEQRAHEVERFIAYDLAIALRYLVPGMRLPLIRVFDSDVDQRGSLCCGLGAQDLVRTQNRMLLCGPLTHLVQLVETLGLQLTFRPQRLVREDGKVTVGCTLCISLQER